MDSNTTWHLILRRCEPDGFEQRKIDYESVGFKFESAWHEGADSADKYPHVHCVVHCELSKKTLQARLNKRFPQYNSQHVFKDVFTSEYEQNLLPYVCKDWNPLITTDSVLEKYGPFRGLYNFNKNMKIKETEETKALAKDPSHKRKFNATIIFDFEQHVKDLQQQHKNKQSAYPPSKRTEWHIGQISDRKILEWLKEKYRCFQQDIDPIILMRKYWVIKSQFEHKGDYELVDIVMKRLAEQDKRK